MPTADLYTASRRAIFGIVGESPAMRDVFRLIRAAAATDITVLVEGETGTGKELVARAIAENGARRGRPFVAINCGALSESLLDAELFGYRRGAFTGASDHRRGLLEAAQNGTVFLDEITSMSAGFQAKLLRVLENAEVKAVGHDRATHVDLRIVAASNQRLEDCVRAGQFRADLLYRLNAFPIVLPPLRERLGDVPLLVDHFLARTRRDGTTQIAAVAPAALALLMRYDYPGNLRQLRNEIARAATLAAGGERIEVEHLSLTLRMSQPASWDWIASARLPASASAACGPAAPVADAPSLPAIHRRRAHALGDVERRAISEALEHHGYNVSRAAAALRMSRFGFRKRMRRLGLDVRRSLVSLGEPLSVSETADAV